MSIPGNVVVRSTVILCFSLLDETLSKQCAEYQRCYADILYRWGLLTQRAEVLKHQSVPASTQQEFSEIYSSDYDRTTTCFFGVCMCVFRLGRILWLQDKL